MIAVKNNIVEVGRGSIVTNLEIILAIVLLKHLKMMH